MGLSSTTNRVSYVGDGSSTIFSFPYEFFSTSDLQVYLYDSGSSIIQPQVLNTNYSIAGGQNTNGIFPNGGTVVFTSAVPTNFQIIAVRAPTPVQNYVLLQNGQINSGALVQQFDYLTALVQRLQDEVSRSLLLPDGLGTRAGVTFSQQLPSSVNLASSAFQVLTINSGASGWTLSVVPGVGAIIPVVQGGTGQGAPLVDGAIIYAVNSSTMAPSTQGTAGQVLLSGGALAPSWGSVSIGSGAVTAGSIQGILGLYQGGTNTGSSYSYPVGSVIVASGVAAAQQFVGVAPVLPGLPLVQQGSSLPTFQALPLSGPAFSGVLPLGLGGTNSGSGVFFPVSGVVIASAGVQMAALGGGQVGVVLTSQGSSAPTWQLLNLSNQVQGTLGILSGGTGQVDATKAFNALSPQTTTGDLAVYSQSSIVRLAAGGAGLVLTGNGAGNLPSYQSPAASVAVTNSLTNGAFDWWQQFVGSSIVISNGSSTYNSDQWYVKNSLGTLGMIQFARVAGAVAGSKYGVSISVTVAGSSTTGVELYQPLCNLVSLPFFNQTGSFQIQVKALGNVNQVGVQFLSSTSEVKLATTIGSEVLTTVNSATFSACTINGQAMGSSWTTSGIVGVRIRPTGVSSGNLYDIGVGFVAEQAMMNLGATAATFARKFNSPTEELRDCQYFLSKTFSMNTPVATNTTVVADGVPATVYANGANSNTIAWVFPATMRLNSSVISTYNLFIAGGTGMALSGSGNVAVSTYTQNEFSVGFRNTGGVSAGSQVNLGLMNDCRI